MHAKAILFAATALALGGCSSFYRGAAITTAGAAGAAGGAGVGYLIKPNDPVSMIAGGSIGAATAAGATALALGEDRTTLQKGYDEGYNAGQADSVKSLYWAKQNMERGDSDAGRQVYYTFPGPEQKADGTRLVPHDVTVPIVQ